MIRRLILRESERNAIAAHLAQNYPAEGCGLLLGRLEDAGIAVMAVAPTANVAADPRKYFEVDPAAILRCQRETRGRGLEIVGHFHSHPDGEARLSRTDLASASWTDLAWLVVAMSKGEAVDWRSFWLRHDNEFEAMEIAT